MVTAKVLHFVAAIRSNAIFLEHPIRPAHRSLDSLSIRSFLRAKMDIDSSHAVIRTVIRSYVPGLTSAPAPDGETISHWRFSETLLIRRPVASNG